MKQIPIYEENRLCVINKSCQAYLLFINLAKEGIVRGDQNIEKKGDNVADSGTSGFASSISPLTAAHEIILLIPGHALPLCYL